jgi:Tol biopolymer transport system component
MTKLLAALAALTLAACAAPQADAPPAAPPAPSIEYSLEVLDIASGARRVVLTRTSEIGPANWSADGTELIFNAGGLLYAMPAQVGAAIALEEPNEIHIVRGQFPPRFIDTGAQNIIVSDHAPSPDGALIAFSAYNVPDPATRVASIFLVPAAGGAPRQLTSAGPSYFHSWSPDGARIAFTGRRGENNYDVYDIDIASGEERRLTEAPGTDDGADYAPDGAIYFNSARTGAMRIWKMDSDGENQTQLTDDARYQDWFPHPSPDGAWLVWLAYPGDIEGLQSNQPVTLRLASLAAAAPPRDLAHFTGGQGSINAPPWSPDSTRIAFVSHRVLPSP